MATDKKSSGGTSSSGGNGSGASDKPGSGTTPASGSGTGSKRPVTIDLKAEKVDEKLGSPGASSASTSVPKAGTTPAADKKPADAKPSGSGPAPSRPGASTASSTSGVKRDSNTSFSGISRFFLTVWNIKCRCCETNRDDRICNVNVFCFHQACFDRWRFRRTEYCETRVDRSLDEVFRVFEFFKSST